MSKMTETIKKVQAAAEAVLDRAINPEEVIQAIEAIEILVGAAQKEQPKAVETTVQALPVYTPAISPKRKYKKRRAIPLRTISWRKHTEWLDLVLNGGVHVISTNNLGEIMTSKSQISNKLRKEAKLRGFKTVQITFNDKNRTVRIHAVK